MRIDRARLAQSIEELGKIGATPRGGLTRLALTDADHAGRDQLVAWMRDLDLAVQVDRIGNIFGALRRPGTDAEVAGLMIGSHIDTVTNAGALDGCYGVLAGLAVARAFRQAGRWPRQPLVIAALSSGAEISRMAPLLHILDKCNIRGAPNQARKGLSSKP